MSMLTNPDKWSYEYLRESVPDDFQIGLYVPVSSTIQAFHNSTAFTRFVFGPFGSGKSVSCMMEIFRRACEQRPFQRGPDAPAIRRTRFAIIRDTYRNLENTTIKTWREAFDRPEGAFGRFVKSPLPTHHLNFELPDGTFVESEIIFLALDSDDDVEKLKSLEVTGFYLNEMSGLPEGLLGILAGRLRFPSKAEGGITWKGIIGDTNGVPEDHWVYDVFEVNRPDDCVVFKQPPAVREIGRDRWQINPDCDNYHNLPDGYYDQQLGLYSRSERICYLGVGYATLKAGLPVHEDYSETMHRIEFTPDPNLPIDICMDWGLTPAAAILQQRADGGVDIIGEVVNTRADARQLADQTTAYIKDKFPTNPIRYVTGDPSGTAGAQADKSLSCFGVWWANGYPQAEPCETNDPSIRRYALATCLRQQRAGVPMVRLHETNCPTIHSGLAGKFRFKKRVGLENVYDEIPEKNLQSHICEALEYGFVRLGFARDIEHERQRARVGKANMRGRKP